MPSEKDNVKYGLHLGPVNDLNLQALEHSSIVIVPSGSDFWALFMIFTLIKELISTAKELKTYWLCHSYLHEPYSLFIPFR